jgi:GLPGLI family protein
MQKYLVTMIVFALTMGAQGQTETIDTAQFMAVYDYQCRTMDDEENHVVDSMEIVVQVGSTMTKSMPWSQSSLRQRTFEEEGKVYQEAFLHMQTIWTGWPEGQTTTRELIFPYIFEGKEPTPEMKWTLSDDTVTVCGYICQKATTMFRGVEWNVCYTEEIPSSAGPWRLHGLPGLIVLAESEAHTFTLTQVRQEATPITYQPDPEARKLTYKKLLKYRNETYGNKQYAKNPLYYLPDFNELLRSFQGSQVTILTNINAYFLDWRPMLTKAHVYQPLEKE